MFLRESEGVYLFGQKRVYMKIERGDRLRCRVGGGFLDIDDFMEQYGPIEAGKYERRSVVNRFQKKRAVQSVLNASRS